MDAPGTEARREYTRSTVLFVSGVVLFLTCALLVFAGERGKLDVGPWIDSLTMYVLTPASTITWILSFQGIRRRPLVAAIVVTAAYFWGLMLFIMLLYYVGGVAP